MARRTLLAPPSGPPGYNTPAVNFPHETARAKAAFALYLELPPPRDLKALVGSRPTGPRGQLGKPFSLSMLRTWSWKYKWQARAENHDDQVLRDKELALRTWKVNEHTRRLKLRLAAADVQRMMALDTLKFPADTPPDPQTGRPRANLPRPMHDIEPRYLDIAGRFLRDSAESERADLADVMHGPTDTPAPPVQVATDEQIAQLRQLVNKFPTVAPRLVIEGHVGPDGRVLSPPAAPEIIEGELVAREPTDAG